MITYMKTEINVLDKGLMHAVTNLVSVVQAYEMMGSVKTKQITQRFRAKGFNYFQKVCL